MTVLQNKTGYLKRCLFCLFCAGTYRRKDREHKRPKVKHPFTLHCCLWWIHFFSLNAGKYPQIYMNWTPDVYMLQMCQGVVWLWAEGRQSHRVWWSLTSPLPTHQVLPLSVWQSAHPMAARPPSSTQTLGPVVQKIPRKRSLWPHHQEYRLSGQSHQYYPTGICPW